MRFIVTFNICFSFKLLNKVLVCGNQSVTNIPDMQNKYVVIKLCVFRLRDKKNMQSIEFVADFLKLLNLYSFRFYHILHYEICKTARSE